MPLAAHAQTGCVPNPNDSAPPFIPGCPITAQGLNNLGVNSTVSPKTFGAVGNGVADDTAAVQAAIDQAQTTGQTVFVGDALYGFSATLKDNAKAVRIMGSPTGRSHFVGSGQVCTTGLRVLAADLAPALEITGAHSQVFSVCMDHAAGVSNTSGVGIGVYNTAHDAHIEYNYLVGYCVEIDITGAGTVNEVDVVAAFNTLVPANASGCAAFRIGKNSLTAHTPDSRLLHNDIFCSNANGLADGIVIYDSGGILVDGNTPFGCNLGTWLRPGHFQSILWSKFRGVLGDTSTTNDLLVDPQDPQAVIFGQNFTDTWASNALNGASVKFANTGAAPSYSGFVFNAHQTYGHNANTALEVDALVKDLTISGSTFCTGGNAPQPTATAIVLGPSGAGSGPQRVDIEGTVIGACAHFTNNIGFGMVVNESVDATFGSIHGNMFRGISDTNIVWNRTSEIAAIIENNYPISQQQGAITLAADLDIGMTPVGYVTGTGTTITCMGPVWNGRTVTLFAKTSGGIEVGTGGSCTGNQRPFEAPFTQTDIHIGHVYTYNQGDHAWDP